MKLLLATAFLCVTLGNATPLNTEPTSSEKKNKAERKKNGNEDSYRNKNLHSIKKWKITIEYTNGTKISKTIVVDKTSDLSALETAFQEADRHIKDFKNVKDYTVSPIGSSFVLLAGD
ncbi:hypothetical protein M0D21_01375 [Aquimarina sp. D1M17]|uniref:hypothetical protein n=1 Tax=Aquimarina acroporae TaxID=2937283 RepID=UPI0020BD7325|nr:hypothetical protein [Aquimarina acroporae]MCK8520194.1 hypothetical protein [Aquimarina acroporae]